MLIIELFVASAGLMFHVFMLTWQKLAVVFWCLSWAVPVGIPVCGIGPSSLFINEVNL